MTNRPFRENRPDKLQNQSPVKKSWTGQNCLKKRATTNNIMLRSKAFVTGKITEVLRTKRHHRYIDFTCSKPSFITFIEILKLRTILYKIEKWEAASSKKYLLEVVQKFPDIILIKFN